MNERTHIRGEFHLKVIRNGVVEQTISEANLIVDTGFETVQALFAAPSIDKELSKICFGAIASGDPDSPAADWDVLPSEDVTKNVDSVTFPTLRSVSVNWTLTGLEGNGLNIAYYGLKTEDETLFAAKSRPSIAKTSDIVLEGTWIIHF
jgi:hypothetical protein